MAIFFDRSIRTFFLDGKDLTYVFRINSKGYLCHLWCGGTIGHDNLIFSNHQPGKRAFFASIPGEDDVCHAYMNYHPEISFFGTGDYREPSVLVESAEGDRLCDLLYESHEIVPTKPAISGMPSLDGGETLIVHLKDQFGDFGADLYYTVYDDASVIARRIVYKNGGSKPCRLHRAYSFAMGLPGQDYEVLALQGAWASERSPERIPLRHGVVSIDSKRCTSSSTLNPFMAILSKGATETQGRALGINLVYSSSFVLKAEGTGTGNTVLTGGINDFDFSWTLEGGESLETPEVVLAVSEKGLGGMSRAFHDAYRNHLIPKKHVFAHRPVVINNWEGTYFDFDTEKLKAIVDAVEGTGIDTFVLDDGWFGTRNNSNSGLGDWYVNQEKVDLKEIIEYTHAKGLKFGLWFEPEMISEDSDLYRAHPDYAIGKPNRPRCYSRHQYMLDLTRKEVRDYAVNAVNRILSTYDVDYVKWDYNRNVTDIYSLGLPADRQTEFAHRYALGVYDLFERIVKANPDIFFEGCSGGGARFDPAVMYYFPQIWTSDNTDAHARTMIQYGTSLVYPLSTMSCHVSAVPNHQTSRVTALETRGNIAHMGATGYELDTTKLSDEEKAQVREQVGEYLSLEELMLKGDLYRIDSPFEGNFFTQMVVSKDRSQAVLLLYRSLAHGNPEPHYVTLQGLDPDKTYRIEGLNVTAQGRTLMKVGLLVVYRRQDFDSEVYRITEIK